MKIADSILNIPITFSQMKFMFDDFYDEITLMNSQGKILYINKVSTDLYGMPPSALIGKSADECVEKGYWEPALYHNIIKNGKKLETKQRHGTGKYYEVSGFPIVTENHLNYILWHKKHRENPQNEQLKAQDPLYKNGEDTIIATSPSMYNCLMMSKKISTVDSTVLILGETGTGKSQIAKYIHNCSNRKEQPFITVNCGSLPETLIESELFGYCKGAFTGASSQGKVGLVSCADKGTLFLDEIGELPLHLQTKLLTLLQDGTFFQIGGTKAIHCDIRVIAATNKNLLEMTKSGSFREDLYYRLSVIDFEMPALRNRVEDILPLSLYFLERYNNKYGYQRDFSEDTIGILRQYCWPGNIRELSNIIEKLVILSPQNIIKPEHMPKFMLINAPSEKRLSDQKSIYGSPLLSLKEQEENLILEYYKELKSSYKVAETLGISQTKAAKVVREHRGK